MRVESSVEGTEGDLLRWSDFHPADTDPHQDLVYLLHQITSDPEYPT